MSLSYWQEHELRLIDAGLRRSDPRLGAMFGVFGRLYTEEDMPAREQVPSSQGRFQPAAWIAAVLDAAAAASCALLTVAFTLVVVMRRSRAEPHTVKADSPVRSFLGSTETIQIRGAAAPSEGPV
jgi:hypothetical protein